MLSRIYRTELDLRKKQINTLKVFNDNVTEISEGYEYQVSFMSGNNEVCLRVTLPSDFPKEKPILSISPILIHPWVTSDGEVISAPGLLNFTVHSDLGRVVQAITREFERNPPPLKSEQSINKIMPSNVAVNDVINSASSTSQYYYKFPLKNISSADTSTSTIAQSIAFPELNLMSLDELKFLNESVDRQEEFLDNLPQVREIHKHLDELFIQVEELVEENLSKKEHLEDAKERINSAVEEVTKLTFENERLHNVYQSLSDKFSPKNIKDQLRLAAEKGDNESEMIAESFLKGATSVDNFLSMYIKTRTLYQTRKAKEEKLAQQINSLEKAGF